MNYRHAYHAGNFADVLKHVTLVALLEHLGRKEAPYFYLDTHAGRGDYPLAAAETQRAGEYRDGILRLVDAAGPPPAVARYLDLVRELGYEQGHLASYPGSPRVAVALLRVADRAALCELEPREADALRSLLRGDPRAQVHERDGYEALLALLPPREKRGLVLIDPPFEQPDEFERVERALYLAHDRWPGGVYAVWYPIKAGGADGRFLARLAASGIRRQLVAELTVARDDSPGGLNGAGMLIINPPWQLDERLGAALPWLQQRLAAAGRGRWRVSWLVPE
ncbi:MAG TPA: 23S rRNA (adenine(2030)-N(6))-methyltransferase RlmJ [Steroidobacteraceae bacterium]|nr:23S rRNA (adenine(2030)-N(6))-methyltransferase RlmJ [Steroidobacteraceae bacterium]